MRELAVVFIAFFSSCDSRQKFFFYLGAFSSAFAGLSEALLFKQIGDVFQNSSLESLNLLTVTVILLFRFFWVYASAFFISRGSSLVTQRIMEHFIAKNSLGQFAGSTENNIPQVISESERIGMGYYLAWQNILSNLLQFLALVLAAAVLTSREFGIVLLIILPLYLAFSQATSVVVSRLGFTRMDNLRKLSSEMSKDKALNPNEVSGLVAFIISSIFKVRVWSLIQKPSLELIGILGLSAAIVIDLSISGFSLETVLPAYVLLATIFIRFLPYVNQIQNGFTLAASVQHEVKSYNQIA